MFFTHWPLKLLQSPYSKVRLTSSLPLRPNGCIFLAFNAPSQFFLGESRKATAWWEQALEMCMYGGFSCQSADKHVKDTKKLVKLLESENTHLKLELESR